MYKEYAEKGYTSTKTHTVNGNDGKQHSKVNTSVSYTHLEKYNAELPDEFIKHILKARC